MVKLTIVTIKVHTSSCHNTQGVTRRGGSAMIDTHSFVPSDDDGGGGAGDDAGAAAAPAAAKVKREPLTEEQAARKIQGLFRMSYAKKSMRAMLFAIFEKVRVEVEVTVTLRLALTAVALSLSVSRSMMKRRGPSFTTTNELGSHSGLSQHR